MTQEEIISMAKEITQQFGVRMTDEYGETHGEELYCMGIDDIVEAIKLIAAHEREACAEAEKQERNFCPRCGKRTNDIHTCTPPQLKREPLTDEQISEIAAQGYARWLEFARAIEAAHGIKGEA